MTTCATAKAVLRQKALAYPGVREDHPWGHDAFKVNEKVFLFLGGTTGTREGLSLSVKLPVKAQLALELPFCEPTGYGMGKHGWVSAEFSEGDFVPVDLLIDWLDESFRAIAPKRVVAALPVARLSIAARKPPPEISRSTTLVRAKPAQKKPAHTPPATTKRRSKRATKR